MNKEAIFTERTLDVHLLLCTLKKLEELYESPLNNLEKELLEVKMDDILQVLKRLVLNDKGEVVRTYLDHRYCWDGINREKIDAIVQMGINVFKDEYYEIKEIPRDYLEIIGHLDAKDLFGSTDELFFETLINCYICEKEIHELIDSVSNERTSKKQIIRELELQGDIEPGAKINTIYKKMQKILISKHQDDTLDQRDSLNQYESKMLKLYVTSSNEKYIKAINSLPNEKKLSNLTVNDVKRVENKVKASFEKNSDVISQDPSEQLLNELHIQDTFHFNVFSAYEQLVSNVTKRILSTIPIMGTQSSLFSLLIIDQFAQQLDSITVSFERTFIKAKAILDELERDDVIKTKIDTAMEEPSNLEYSVYKMFDLLGKHDVNKDSQMDVMSKVIATYYNSFNDSHPLKN